MLPRSLRSLAAASVVAFLAAGCATDVTLAPQGAAPRSPAIHDAAAVLVHPLQRTSDIAGGSVSAWVTPWTTTVLTIPGTGATVTVPPLAVSEPVSITMTAVGGRDVAYEFYPSGLHFNVPLAMTQSFLNTEANAGGLLPLSSVFVGYFHDGDPFSLIQEILPVSSDAVNQTGTASIWHFSGYVWASGDSGEL